MPNVCNGKNNIFELMKNDTYANLPIKSLKPYEEIANTMGAGVEAAMGETETEFPEWKDK